MPRAPLVQAHYRLARAFGWTPDQIQGMTMAQVTLFLEMLEQDS